MYIFLTLDPPVGSRVEVSVGPKLGPLQPVEARDEAVDTIGVGVGGGVRFLREGEEREREKEDQHIRERRRRGP